MKITNALLCIQGGYYFVTGAWPILHIESFMFVSGYKQDLWLVKTVGALLIPVSLTLLSYTFLHSDRRPAFVLGSLTAMAFIIIDFYYALTDVISNIYLADGVVQICLLISWIYLAATNRLTSHKKVKISELK